MTELEGFSYAVFAVYAVTSFGLALAGQRLGVTKRVGRPLVGLAVCAGAGVWPLLRLAIGDPLSPDPLHQRLDGLTGDLVGHGLLAMGALTAMMAEVQILTRGSATSLSPDEAPAGPPVGPPVGPPARPQAWPLTQMFVVGGRIVQLLGLFLVFPSVMLAGLALIAAIGVAVVGRSNTPQGVC